MPEGHASRKKGQARKPAENPLTIERKQTARYSGLISRICSFHKLEGISDEERFEAVASFYKRKEEERRNRPPAF